MVNKVSKGNKAENERIRFLEDNGFICLPRPPRIKFKKSTDYFGKWDICAYYPRKIGFEGKWLLEQVKSNKTPNLEKYKEYAREIPANTLIRIAVRKDGNRNKSPEWKIYTYMRSEDRWTTYSLMV